MSLINNLFVTPPELQDTGSRCALKATLILDIHSMILHEIHSVSVPINQASYLAPCSRNASDTGIITLPSSLKLNYSIYQSYHTPANESLIASLYALVFLGIPSGPLHHTSTHDTAPHPAPPGLLPHAGLPSTIETTGADSCADISS